jgi:hypothetical protein
MRRLLVISAVATVALCAAVPSAIAGPHAQSDSEVSGTRIRQAINVVPDAIHFWFHASNPAGVSPFCVTLQLERKGPNGWQGIGMSSRRGIKECCPQPDEECFPTETVGVWDLFIYPRGKLLRRVEKGRLRIRGFSDFGPSVSLRLDR